MHYKLVLIIAVVIFFPVAILLNAINVIDSPRVHWRFDGNGNDSGAYHNDALISRPEFVAGKNGEALSLDGSNFAVVRDSPYVRLQGPFTITLIAKTDNLRENTGIIGRLLGDSRGGFQIFDDGNALLFKKGGQTVNITTSRDTGNYHLIAITYDGNRLTTYYDGMAQESVPVKFSTTSAPGSMIIGKPLGTNGYAGEIDDLRIYEKALSPIDALVMRFYLLIL